MNKIFCKMFVSPLILIGCLNFRGNNQNSFNNESIFATKSATLNNKVAETDSTNTYLESPCYINSFIKSLDELKSYASGDHRPSNAIMYINENLEICDSSLNTFGISLKDAYTNYIMEKMIPVFYITNEKIADNFINYIDNVYYILDMAVCSNNAEIVKQIRNSVNGSKIRGIIDYSTSNEVELSEMVKNSNVSKANTIIISEEMSTFENLRYLYSRFKVVWTKVLEFNSLNVANYLTRGTYGIITDDISGAYKVYDSFANSPLKTKNVNRPSLNIAHRGMPKTNYENTLEGCIDATTNGASHIEIDGHLTKDKKIVIMHDETIDRTTNGTGAIKDMTLEEIRQYKVIKNNSGITMGDGANIPTLDEIFTYYKGKDTVIVFEIKCSDIDFVEVFKTYLDKYDIYDQVVCISFYNEQLKRMFQQIPEIPCATLNTFKEGMFNKITSDGIAVLNNNNFGTDFNYGGSNNASYDKKLAERGFTGYYWTFDNSSNIYTALNSGLLGVTNNEANVFKDLPLRLITDEVYEIKYDTDYIESVFEVKYSTYSGDSGNATLSAFPILIEEHDSYANAIIGALYKGESGTPQYKGVIFSDIVKIEKKEEKKNINNTILISIIASIVGLILILCGIFFLKKRKKS